MPGLFSAEERQWLAASEELEVETPEEKPLLAKTELTSERRRTQRRVGQTQVKAEDRAKAVSLQENLRIAINRAYGKYNIGFIDESIRFTITEEIVSIIAGAGQQLDSRRAAEIVDTLFGYLIDNPAKAKELLRRYYQQVPLPAELKTTKLYPFLDGFVDHLHGVLKLAGTDEGGKVLAGMTKGQLQLGDFVTQALGKSDVYKQAVERLRDSYEVLQQTVRNAAIGEVSAEEGLAREAEQKGIESLFFNIGQGVNISQ